MRAGRAQQRAGQLARDATAAGGADGIVAASCRGSRAHDRRSAAGALAGPALGAVDAPPLAGWREGMTRSHPVRALLRSAGLGRGLLQARYLWRLASDPAFWKLALKNADEGLQEILRSLSKARFVRSIQTLIPEIQPSDVTPAGAGVRAQALANDGALVDDFLILSGERQLHVCNAPSPAATASLEIAREIVSRIPPP